MRRGAGTPRMRENHDLSRGQMIQGAFTNFPPATQLVRCTYFDVDWRQNRATL